MDRIARPPNPLAYLGQYLNPSGFPQVFAPGFFGAQANPHVKLPHRKLFRAAYRAADQSTVRVIVSACGGVQLGSGWVAGKSTVVTNAHVVAGGRRVTIQDIFGRHPGKVVLFDDRIDVAVIRVPALREPALRLDMRPLRPGAKGVTLGYPGSRRGVLFASKAAVQRRLTALGRDIYGRSFVTRKIYQLRASVQQGDSGGPFVVRRGRVAGVVFAASMTQPDTGYALTAKQVAPDVAKGLRSRHRVATGPCTR
jgi:S1-C subfamily serine protease